MEGWQLDMNNLMMKKEKCYGWSKRKVSMKIENVRMKSAFFIFVSFSKIGPTHLETVTQVIEY